MNSEYPSGGGEERPVISLGKTKELRKPTLREAIELYPKIAETQRMRTGGTPSKNTVSAKLCYFHRIVKELNCSLDIPYDSINTTVMNELYERFVAQGISKISAKSFLEGFRGIFAKWTHFYYEQYGFKVEDVKLPPITLPPNRYRERPSEFKTKVVGLYKKIKTSDPDAWFFMTMMLQFGMRNGDVRRLTWDNFVQDDVVKLCYIPHKTRLTSGRSINWPIADEIWEEILDYKLSHSERPFIWDDPSRAPFWQRCHCRPTNRKYSAEDSDFSEGYQGYYAERRLRRYMRLIGCPGSKSAYELRKLCAGAVYKNLGQEAVSSLLGDDISTVLHFYADPSTVGSKINISSLL